MPDSRTPQIASLLAQAGCRRDEPTGAVSFPIYHSAIFRHPTLGASTGFDYSRTANPTREALESTVTALERGAGAFAFASGMAAITAALLIFRPGDHLVVSEDLYGGTYRLIERLLSEFGVCATYVDTSDVSAVEGAITPTTRGLFVETPSNPLMRISDLSALAALAKRHGLVAIADNTFLTPYLQRPLDLGFDLVVHSATKYLGGHNDVVAGLVVVKSKSLAERIGFLQNATGGILGPQDSWLVLRGLKTLAVRLDRQQSNAVRLAEWLDDHPAVERVLYPGLGNHQGRAVQERQAAGPGAMISFVVRDAARVESVLARVARPRRAA
jgi:cystathionine gamma-synthase